MKGRLYFMPSRINPSSITLMEKGVYCFKSNKKSTTHNFHGVHMGILISNENPNDDLKILTDLTICLNLFSQNYFAIHYLSQNQFTIVEEIEDDDLISLIEKKYLGTENALYTFDFEKEERLHGVTMRFQYVFKKLYSQIRNLDKESELYKKISFIAIIDTVEMTINRVYHNANMYSANLFILFESILNEIVKDDPSKVEICSKCGHHHRRGLSKKIDDFFEIKKINNIDLKKTCKAISSVRHKFFHSKAEATVIQNIDCIMSKKKNDEKTISLSEDLANGASVIGTHFLKDFLVIYLIEELPN